MWLYVVESPTLIASYLGKVVPVHSRSRGLDWSIEKLQLIPGRGRVLAVGTEQYLFAYELYLCLPDKKNHPKKYMLHFGFATTDPLFRICLIRISLLYILLVFRKTVILQTRKEYVSVIPSRSKDF